MQRHPQRFKTITADNGTEFHDYAVLERATGTTFYFATPHHAWARGTSMTKLSQQRCNAIARQINQRPCKRLAFKTPQECFNEI